MLRRIPVSSGALSQEDALTVLSAIRASQPARGIRQPLLRLLWRPWTSLWLFVPASFRRTIYHGLWWAGKKWYGRGEVNAQCAPFGLFLKRGDPAILRAGSLANIHVAMNTTIPVPTVLDLINDGEFAMMVTTQIPGESVRFSIQEGRMTEEYFESIMRDWLTQLRNLPVPDPQRVSGFDGGRCLSFRVYRDPIGPFPSMAAFHKKLLWMCPMAAGQRLEAEVAPKSHDKSHRILFAHGDLHVNNILAHNDQVSGLVDWDSAGWYPEYWDYAVAIYHHRRFPFWVDCFSRIFPQYEDELEVEKAIWEVHCPW
ncbi:hypothetical protein QCA50_008639 [Cerrena zonata]|uniref:Aminoglycoside phosphotransferase domain-containing protein n=1 Tax=Cerrena zonata TaxID=2478898 RepID=A0AAW0GDZ1_9APHY